MNFDKKRVFEIIEFFQIKNSSKRLSSTQSCKVHWIHAGFGEELVYRTMIACVSINMEKVQLRARADNECAALLIKVSLVVEGLRRLDRAEH